MSTVDSGAYLLPGVKHPFLVCSENQFAYTASFGLARRGESQRGMIVTLVGPTGTGKSHLLREAARHFARRHSAARVAETTGHELTEVIASSISSRTVEQLRDDYATVDLLVCDDFNDIPGNRTIQEQVEILFDRLTDNGGMILLASPKAPGELRHISSRLVNRCHGGVISEVGLPEAASRRKLLKHFAGSCRIAVPADVLERLVESLMVSGRELLSLLKRLHEFSRARKQPLTRKLLDEMLDEELQRAAVSVSRIARTVAGEFGISLREMQSGSRARRTLISRQTAMLLAREAAGTPLSEIGAYFGGRNHSTVVHACQRAQQLTETDPEVASVVAKIRQLLNTNRREGSRKPDNEMSTHGRRTG